MISCTQCKTPLDTQVVNTFALVPCPSCRGMIRADAYPALFRKLPSGHFGDYLEADKEAGCFYHPGKKAVIACFACGRFLCALCDVEINDRHLCPLCLEKSKTKRKLKSIENHRVCYDTIALLVSIVSMVFIWFTILTAPTVLFITIRYWNAPNSIIPRSKIRFILAALIACLQISGWILFFAGLIST